MMKGKAGTIWKRAVSTALAACLSLMMVPAVAFADIGGVAYEVEVDASQEDSFNTLGQDVSSSYKPAVGVIADNGHTAEAALGDVTAKDMKRAVLVEADGGGTADVTVGDVVNSYQWAGDGIDVVAKGGSVDLVAGDVKAGAFGLNLDNAPTGTESYAGEKRVTVGSVTQTRDSKYNYAGANAFSYAKGDINIVQVNGDVNAAGSRGLDVLARGESETTVTVDGTVNANYLGVKLEAGCDGSVNGTTISTGTATVKVGGVVAKNYDQAVVIDSNTKGSVATFQSDGDIEALASGSTGIWARSAGGKSVIAVDGDVSGRQAGLFIYCDEVGSNDVLVTGTISGKNGVDISYDSAANDSLTVWKIEKAASGQYVSGEVVGTTIDERETFAKKQINYIVKVAQGAEAAVANLRAAKDAGGTALDSSHGYDVAKEGAKVYLVVDEGYRIVSASNGNDGQTVLQDAQGNYYIVVKRGGGIDLNAIVESIDDVASFPFIAPPMGTNAPVAVPVAASAGVVAGGSLPLLTDDGVRIDDVKLEMKDQAPNLRVTLSNMNDHDVDFDCTKFKVVKAGDDSEVTFKTDPEIKQLRARETSECTLSADVGALKPGDRTYIYYADRLLGTYVA